MQTIEVKKMLDSVTATTTSNNFYVGDCSRVGFIVTRAANAGGTSTFSFKGGMSSARHTTAPTMVSLNVISTNVANTNAQTILLTTGAAIANANGSRLLWLDMEKFPVEFVQCTVTETSDGTHSAWLIKVID